MKNNISPSKISINIPLSQRTIEIKINSEEINRSQKQTIVNNEFSFSNLSGFIIGIILTEVQKYTILRAVHKYKDSREQFESRTHKRLIDINNPSKETIDALSHLDLPSGVDIQIKY